FACYPGILVGQETTSPDQIRFRRQAVRRMVFDKDQAIPLARFTPEKAIAFDVMHPERSRSKFKATCDIRSNELVMTSENGPSDTVRWIGGFNPFATYDLELSSVTGTGAIGISFRDSESDDRLDARLRFNGGNLRDVHWQTVVAGQEVDTHTWPLPSSLIGEQAVVFRVQMAAVGANVFVESMGVSHLIGIVDFSEHIELREQARAARYEFAISASMQAKAETRIRGASAAITPGTGQADTRAMTDERGRPLLDDGRLWFTVTMRGRALPHPMQGVVSLNPSVFDLRFEGLIVFESGDGLLRNELASHIFRDTKTSEWRGWTTGFSAFGNQDRHESKAILAVSSTRDPRKGFSIMKATPVGIEGAHEDPHCVYDTEAKKWRLLLCERAGKYRAAMWESDHWDRGFTRIAGPVPMDSTGTSIQAFDGKRFALFGSADRKIYIRNYPDLTPAGELNVHLPPWNESHGTRVWPNVIPLPEGYPAPYIALMMDRVNFPNMPKRNWTYGAMYLYHGYRPTFPSAPEPAVKSGD
ncbi:MAG: hypothetical protein AAF989_12645, partial [Planctomycetota bacterium]